MRFVSFLQRLGYLVFLQVLLLPCLAYSTFHVSLGHNFRFSFASFCCLYTYFILVGPFPFFCLEWNIFVCVCGLGPLVSGSRFCFGKNRLGIRSKAFGSGTRFFVKKPSISVYVRERLALGAYSLSGTNFSWFSSYRLLSTSYFRQLVY